MIKARCHWYMVSVHGAPRARTRINTARVTLHCIHVRGTNRKTGRAGFNPGCSAHALHLVVNKCNRLQVLTRFLEEDVQLRWVSVRDKASGKRRTVSSQRRSIFKVCGWPLIALLMLENISAVTSSFQVRPFYLIGVIAYMKNRTFEVELSQAPAVRCYHNNQNQPRPKN